MQICSACINACMSSICIYVYICSAYVYICSACIRCMYMQFMQYVSICSAYGQCMQHIQHISCGHGYTAPHQQNTEQIRNTEQIHNTEQSTEQQVCHLCDALTASTLTASTPNDRKFILLFRSRPAGRHPAGCEVHISRPAGRHPAGGK
jgi:hypothetical protein